MKKKLTALFLCFVMVLTMLPVTALAEPGDTEEGAAVGDVQPAGEPQQDGEERIVGDPEPGGDAQPYLEWEWYDYDEEEDTYRPNNGIESCRDFDITLNDELRGRFVLVDGDTRTPVAFRDLQVQNGDGSMYLLSSNEKPEGFACLWAVDCGEFDLAYVNGEDTYTFPVRINPRAIGLYRYVEQEGDPRSYPMGEMVVWPYSDYAPSHKACVVVNASWLDIQDTDSVKFAVPQEGVNSDMTLGTPVVKELTLGEETMKIVICPVTMNELRDRRIEIIVSYNSTQFGPREDWLNWEVDDQRDGLIFEGYRTEGDGEHPRYVSDGGQDRYPWCEYHRDGCGKFFYCKGESRITMSVSDLVFEGMTAQCVEPENDIFRLNTGENILSYVKLSDSGRAKVGLAGSDDYAAICVYTTLPEFGLYGAPERSKANYLEDGYNGADKNVFTYSATNDTLYLITPDNFTLDTKLADGTDGVWSENGNTISVKVDGTGHMATIKILELVEDRIDLRFSGTWGDGRRDCRDVHCDAINVRPAIYAYWAGWDWDNETQEEVYYRQKWDNEQPRRSMGGAPGYEQTLEFVFFDGKQEQPINAKDLSTSGNITLEPLQGESGFARLRETRFGGNDMAAVKYTKDNVTYTFPVCIKLPGIGFYSGQEATKDSYLSEWAYTGRDNTIYLIGLGETVITGVRSDCGADLQIGQIQNNGKLVAITVTEPATQEIRLRVDGRWNENHSFENQDYSVWIDDQRDGLYWRDWDGDTRYLENVSGEWEGQFVYRSGDASTTVPVSDLDISGASYVTIEKTEGSMVRMCMENGAGTVRIRSRSWGGAPVTIYRDTPGFGFFTTPVRAAENVPAKWTYENEQSQIYLLTEENFLPRMKSQNEVADDALVSENGNEIAWTYYGKTEESEAYFAIRVTALRDRDLRVKLTGSYTFDETNEETQYIDIPIRNMQPSLYWTWAEFGWNEETKREEYFVPDWSEPERNLRFVKDQEMVGMLYFGVPGMENNWKRLTIDDLADQAQDSILQVEPVDRANKDVFRLKIQEWGDGVISDKNGNTLEIWSTIPWDVGLYSASRASEETYLTESVDYTGPGTKLYVVAGQEDVHITEVENDRCDFTVEIKDGGAYAIVTLNEVRDSYDQCFEITFYQNNDPNWTRSEYRWIRINDLREGLFLRDFSSDDNGDLAPDPDWVLRSYYVDYPESAIYQFVYRTRNNGELTETVVSADDLSVNDAGLVEVQKKDMDCGPAVYMDFATQFKKDIVFTYTKADANNQVTVHMELPAVGVYSAPQATEENYIKEWLYTGEDSAVYVIAKDPAVEIEDVYFFYGDEPTVENHYNGKLNVAKLSYSKPLDEAMFALGLRVPYGTRDEEGGLYGDEFSMFLSVREGRAGLYLCNARIGARGGWYVPDDAGVISEWEVSPGESIRYNVQPFRIDANGARTVVDLADLELKRADNQPLTAKMESLGEDGIIGIYFYDFGDYILRDTKSNKTLTIHAVLPDAGFYTKPQASEENYVTTWQFKAGGDSVNTLYLVPRDNVEISNFDWDRALAEVTPYGEDGRMAKVVIKSTHLYSLQINYNVARRDGNDTVYSYQTSELRLATVHDRVYINGADFNAGNGDAIHIFLGDRIHLGAVTDGLKDADKYEVAWGPMNMTRVRWVNDHEETDTVNVAGTTGAAFDPGVAGSPFGPWLTIPKEDVKPGDYTMTWYYVDKTTHQKVPNSDFTVTVRVLWPEGYTHMYGSDIRYLDGDTIYVPVGTESIKLAPVSTADVYDEFLIATWVPTSGAWEFDSDENLMRVNGFAVSGSPVENFQENGMNYAGPEVFLPRQAGAEMTLQWSMVRFSTTPKEMGGNSDSWDDAVSLHDFSIKIKMVDPNDTVNEDFSVQPDPGKNYNMAQEDVMEFVTCGDPFTMSVSVDPGNATEISARWYYAESNLDSGDKTFTEIGSFCASSQNAGTITYTIPSVDKAGEYHCEVTDGKGNYRDVVFFVGPASSVMNAKLKILEGGRALDENKNIGAEFNNPVLVPVGGATRIGVDFTDVAQADLENVQIRWMQFRSNPRTDENSTVLVAENVAATQRYTCFLIDRFGNRNIVEFEVQPDTRYGNLYVEGSGEGFGNGDTITVRQGQTIHVGVVTAGLEDPDAYLPICEYNRLDEQNILYSLNEWYQDDDPFAGDGLFNDMTYDRNGDARMWADDTTPAGPWLSVPNQLAAGTYEISWFYAKKSECLDQNGELHVENITTKVSPFTVKLEVEGVTAYTVWKNGGDPQHHYNHMECIEVPVGTKSILIAPYCSIDLGMEDYVAASWWPVGSKDAYMDPDADMVVIPGSSFTISGSPVDYEPNDASELPGPRVNLPQQAGEELIIRWGMVRGSTSPLENPGTMWDSAEELYSFAVRIKMVPNPDTNKNFTAKPDVAANQINDEGNAFYYVAYDKDDTMKVTFTGADDDTKVTYRWYQNVFQNEWGRFEQVDVPNANGKTLTVHVTAPVEYHCVVNDGYGHESDVAFYLGVENHFAVRAEKDKVYVHPGEKALLQVVVTADNRNGIHYNWFKNMGEDQMPAYFENSDAASFQAPAVAASYGCEVLDYYGNLLFVENIEVIPVAPLQITAQPASVDTFIGDEVTFTVAAEGAAGYQWQYLPVNGDRGWLNLEGKTTATLTFTTGSGDAGKQYRCLVFDEHNVSTASNAATLTLRQDIGSGIFGENNEWAWRLDCNGALMLAYLGTAETVTMTATAENGPWANYNGKNLCTYVKTFTVGEGVTAVGANAFAGYANLTTVKLPSTVTSIGADAFANDRITDLYFEGYPATWSSVSKDSAAIAGTVSVHLWKDLTAAVVLPDSIKENAEQKVAVSVKLKDSNGQEINVNDTTAKAADDEVAINGVAAANGTYQMEVSQKGCVTRTVSVTITDAGLTINNAAQSVELVKVGNLNGAADKTTGEETNLEDMACLFTFLAEGNMTGGLVNDDENQRTEEEVTYFKAVADVNGDENVDILDYQSLYEMVRVPASNMAEEALVDVTEDWGRYDALIARIKQENDPARRVEMMRQAEDMVMATYSTIPLFYLTARLDNNPPLYGGTYYVAFNVKDALFNGEGMTYQQAALIREAISTLIDRNAIVNEINAEFNTEFTAANTYIPVGVSDGNGGVFHSGTDGYYDITDFTDASTKAAALKRARTLLEAAGYTFGTDGNLTTPMALTFKISNSTMNNMIGTTIKANLAELGIAVTLAPMDWDSLLDDGVKGNFQMALDYWYTESDSPQEMLSLMVTTARQNWSQLGR